MAHSETISYFDFLTIFAADTEEGTDDAFLVCIASEGMVKDREDSLGLYYYV